MITWIVAFVLMSAAGEPKQMIQSQASEKNCREMAARFGHGGRFVANIDGQKHEARFLYCMWAEDGVVKDIIHPEGEPAS